MRMISSRFLWDTDKLERNYLTELRLALHTCGKTNKKFTAENPSVNSGQALSPLRFL